MFRKDIYDNPDTKGTFYYSSFENYAYWKESNDEIDKEKPYDFTVYDQIGTPSDENAYFYKRGNFMPYNKIEAGKFSSNSNYYDEDGKTLTRNPYVMEKSSIKLSSRERLEHRMEMTIGLEW